MPSTLLVTLTLLPLGMGRNYGRRMVKIIIAVGKWIPLKGMCLPASTLVIGILNTCLKLVKETIKIKRIKMGR